MPAPSTRPRFRACRKHGVGGALWTSFWYDMRGTPFADIPLGTDMDRALQSWRHIADKTPEGLALMETARRARAAVKVATIWDAAPPWASKLYTGCMTRQRLGGWSDLMSAEEFIALANSTGGVCQLTGIPFDVEGKGRRRPFSASADRIDCRKGYVTGNVRIVCLIMNCALSDFGEDALAVASEAFLKRYRGSDSRSGCGSDGRS